jgi:hypothetical protein
MGANKSQQFGSACVLLLVASLCHFTVFAARVDRNKGGASKQDAAEEFVPGLFKARAHKAGIRESQIQRSHHDPLINHEAGDAEPYQPPKALSMAGAAAVAIEPDDYKSQVHSSLDKPESEMTPIELWRAKMMNARMKKRELVAFHESGHAVCGAMIPGYDMVQKITIIPRTNGAAGLTFFAPADERLETGLYSKQYLEAQLAVALGGRVAEEMIFGEIEATTGASNDLKQVGEIATKMVKEWGMSPRIGPISLTMTQEMQYGQAPQWGGQIMALADIEIDRLIRNAYARTRKLLTENFKLMEVLTESLLDRETVTAEEFQVMIAQHGVWMAPYDVYDLPSDAVSLPFGEMPETKQLRATGGSTETAQLLTEAVIEDPVSKLLGSTSDFKQVCQENFQKFDANKNGLLEWDEIVALSSSLYETYGLEKPSDETLKEFFDSSDENKDGVLQEAEFENFFTSFLSQKQAISLDDERVLAFPEIQKTLNDISAEEREERTKKNNEDWR